MLFSLFRCFSMAQYYFYNYFIKLFPKKTIEKRTREYQEWKAGRGLVWEWGREQASPEPRWVVRTLCWCWGALRTPVLNAVMPPRNLAASHLSCDSHRIAEWVTRPGQYLVHPVGMQTAQIPYIFVQMRSFKVMRISRWIWHYLRSGGNMNWLAD